MVLDGSANLFLVQSPDEPSVLLSSHWMIFSRLLNLGQCQVAEKKVAILTLHSPVSVNLPGKQNNPRPRVWHVTQDRCHISSFPETIRRACRSRWTSFWMRSPDIGNLPGKQDNPKPPTKSDAPSQTYATPQLSQSLLKEDWMNSRRATQITKKRPVSVSHQCRNHG